MHAAHRVSRTLCAVHKSIDPVHTGILWQNAYLVVFVESAVQHAFTASIAVYECKSCCCCCCCETLQNRPLLFYGIQMAQFKVLVNNLKLK